MTSDCSLLLLVSSLLLYKITWTLFHASQPLRNTRRYPLQMNEKAFKYFILLVTTAFSQMSRDNYHHSIEVTGSANINFIPSQYIQVRT